MTTASSSSPAQVLQFLPVTGFPADSESRKIVRSHAIRDANRRKRAPQSAKNAGEEKRETLKPLPQGSFTAKFRIAGKVNSKGERKKKVVSEEKEEKENIDGDEEVYSRLKALTKEIRELNRKKTIPVMTGVGKFDPFDTLPVKIGQTQQALIQYRQSTLPQFPLFWI
jgi:hypothetical protein